MSTPQLVALLDKVLTDDGEPLRLSVVAWFYPLAGQGKIKVYLPRQKSHLNTRFLATEVFSADERGLVSTRARYIFAQLARQLTQEI